MDLKGIGGSDEGFKSSPSASQNNRMIDRKIESKSITTSFSANLARRDIDTSQPNCSGKSVRQIVNWLENEKEKGAPSTTPAQSVSSSPFGTDSCRPPRPPTPPSFRKFGTNRDLSNNSSLIDNSKASSGSFQKQEELASRRSSAKIPATPPTMRVPSQPERSPEDESLNYLDYKSYLNDRPLARCLDEKDTGLKERVISETIQRESKTRGAGTVTAGSNGSLDKMRKEDCSHTAEPNSPSVPTTESAALQQIFDRLDKVATTDEMRGKAAASTEAEEQYPKVVEVPQHNRRDPKDVAAY
jgi:hypothetical protein